MDDRILYIDTGLTRKDEITAARRASTWDRKGKKRRYDELELVTNIYLEQKHMSWTSPCSVVALAGLLLASAGNASAHAVRAAIALDGAR